MATDPVCGMYVDERTAELRLVRENRTYYFCASSCLEEFSAPERHLRRLARRLAVAWPLAIAVAVLTYAAPFPGAVDAAFALAAVVQFYPGLDFYRGTYDAIRGRVWNMDVLVAVGTSVAFGYSAAVLALPGRLPSATYFDASSLIIALILSGNYLEHRTRERARGALRRLQELRPTTATRLRDGTEREVPVVEVQPRDRLRVRAGARFPTDGVVLEGRTSVDEALLTGEGLPVAKGPGDPVLAGSINGEGLVTVEATRVGSDTLLAQIGQLVAEAETSRVPLQQLADRIASRFVPFVLLLGGAAALGWFLAGAGGTVGLLVFVSVVITACPCAFGIATPAAIVVGTGRAAEEGILFKGRDSLEQASRIDLVLTDKTGTLTRGRPTLTDLIPVEGASAGRLLALAAGLEAASDHPFARAVRERAGREGVPPLPVAELTVVPGEGVRGSLGGRPVEILRGAPDPAAPPTAGLLPEGARRPAADGKSWSIVREDGRALGVLGFADETLPGTREAIAALAADGIAVALVTGDRAPVAAATARELGISEVHSEVTPEGKVGIVRAYQRAGRRVAFVGDGINDAPALSAADLGIAVGGGTEVAQEAGDVVLLREGFRGIALALRLGRRTVEKVRGNLAWALGYNAVLLPIAAGALVPALGLGIYRLLPMVGAAAMALSSTLVITNSLALRWARLV